MTEIKLTPKDNLRVTLKKISKVSEAKITLFIPKDSSLLSPLTLKLLKKEGEKLGKEITFSAKDSRGQNLLESLKGEELEVSPLEPDFGFVKGDVVEEKKLEAKSKGERLKVRWQNFLPRLKTFKKVPKPFILPLAVSLLLLIGLGTAWWFFPKATITLDVRSEALVKSIEVTASSEGKAVDLEKRIIPAIPLEVVVKDSKEGEATGKKLVGEKAKGTIKIKNWTDNEKTFPQETIVKSVERVEGERLNFLLDSAVSIPAQTATVSATPERRVTTYIPGEKEAKVSASEIGSKYNLTKDSNFTIGELSLDDFEVKNTEDFSGGESRKVTVVSDTDQKKVKADLLSELRERSKRDLEGKLVGDQKLEEGAVSFSTLEEEFDKPVGEEAEEFKVTSKIKAEALVYSGDQLSELLGNLLGEFVPENYILSGEDQAVSVDVSEVDLSEKKVLFQAKIKGYVLPQIDKEKIKRDLAGKPLSFVGDYVSSLPNVDSYGLSLWPPLPGFLRRMPHILGKIEIEIKHQ